MTKKIIGILLAVLMVISMLPVAVFATDENAAVTDEASLLAALANGGDIELGADITATQVWEISKDTTIDGKDFTVTRDAAFKGDLVVVDTGVTLYLSNVTLDGQAPEVIGCGSLIDLSDKSVAVLDTVTCKDNDAAGNGGAVYVHDGARLAVFGSTFTGNVANYTVETYYEGEEEKTSTHDGDGGAIYVHGSADDCAYVYITGTAFTGNTANAYSGGGGAVYGTAAKIDIEKSSFDGNTTDSTAEKGGNGGAIGVYSGTVLNVADSTFGASSGNTAHYRGAGIYLASAGTVGNIYSTSIENGTAGNYAGGLGCTTDTTANLYKVTFTNNKGSKSGYYNAWFYYCAANPLVYQCIVNGEAANSTNTKSSSKAPTFSATETLTSPFTSIEVNAEDLFTTGEAVSPVVDVKSDGAAASSADYDIITGECVAGQTAKILVWAKNNFAGVARATCEVKNLDATVTVNGVTTNYSTFAEAVAAVPADGTPATVKLCKNVVSNGISVPAGKNMTVDLNGFTLTFDKPGAGSNGTKTQGFQLLNGSDIVIKNGTVNIAEENKDFTWASADTTKGIAMLIQNYANLTLENVTVDGTNIAHNGSSVRYILSNNSGDVVITGKTNIIAPEGDWAFDTCLYGKYTAPTVTFDKDFTGTVTGNIELSGGQLEILAGNFNGNFVKYESAYSAGQVVISGGIFSADVTEFCTDNCAVQHNENGTYEVLPKAAFIENLTNEIAELKGQIETLNSDKDALNTQITALTSQKETLDGQVAELNNQVGTLTTENEGLKTQIETLTNDKTALETQVTNLTNEKTELEASITALQNQVAELETSVNALTTEKTNITEEVIRLTADLEAKTATADRLADELEAKSNEAAKLSDDLATKENEAAKLTADLEAKTAEAKKIAEDLAAKTEEATKLADENEELKKQIEELKAENEKLKTENESVKAENETLKTENESVKAENETLKTENETLKTENSTLSTQIAAINKTLASLKAQVTKLTKNVATLTTANTKLTNENAKLTAKTELLSADLGAKVTVSGKTVTISWTAINGAKYDINGKTYTGTSAKFTVAYGSTNKYTVKAYKEVNGEKVYSKATVLTAKIAPAKVATPKATSTVKTKAKATWTKATGASYYQVSVSTSKTGTNIVTKKTTSLTYTATKLTSGKTYYVKVRAVAANGEIGAWSTVKAVKVK